MLSRSWVHTPSSHTRQRPWQFDENAIPNTISSDWATLATQAMIGVSGTIWKAPDQSEYAKWLPEESFTTDLFMNPIDDQRLTATCITLPTTKSSTTWLATTQNTPRKIWKWTVNTRWTKISAMWAEAKIQDISEDGMALQQPMAQSSQAPTYHHTSSWSIIKKGGNKMREATNMTSAPQPTECTREMKTVSH